MASRKHAWPCGAVDGLLPSTITWLAACLAPPLSSTWLATLSRGWTMGRWARPGRQAKQPVIEIVAVFFFPVLPSAPAYAFCTVGDDDHDDDAGAPLDTCPLLPVRPSSSLLPSPPPPPALLGPPLPHTHAMETNTLPSTSHSTLVWPRSPTQAPLPEVFIPCAHKTWAHKKTPRLSVCYRSPPPPSLHVHPSVPFSPPARHHAHQKRWRHRPVVTLQSPSSPLSRPVTPCRPACVIASSSKAAPPTPVVAILPQCLPAFPQKEVPAPLPYVCVDVSSRLRLLPQSAVH